ncbi:hypothetical protein WP12_14400 [Sphingomonas sp. SRS2]|nr:hypothetical protein WP12_14400 [Sphingomonas sp. SRS2]
MFCWRILSADLVTVGKISRRLWTHSSGHFYVPKSMPIGIRLIVMLFGIGKALRRRMLGSKPRTDSRKNLPAGSSS